MKNAILYHQTSQFKVRFNKITIQDKTPIWPVDNEATGLSTDQQFFNYV